MVVLDHDSRPVDSSTDCKEEVGEMMVADGFNKLVVNVEERWTNVQINSLMRKMRAHERSVGVKRQTDIQRVERHRKYLYIEFSTRWSHNSLAHSIYMTWLRLKIAQIRDDNTWTDEDHLAKAEWIIKLVKAKGLSVLGVHKHHAYTGGMVRISEVMERGCFWWVNEDRYVGKRYLTPYSGMTKLYWEEFPLLKAKWDKDRPRRYIH